MGAPNTTPGMVSSDQPLGVLPTGNVISPQTAYVMTDMLRGVVREGTGNAASIVPANVAGKTGTSNDHKDTWFVGYTPQVMTGIWVGYEKISLSMSRKLGKQGTHLGGTICNRSFDPYPRSEFPVRTTSSLPTWTGKRAGSLPPRRASGSVSLSRLGRSPT